MNVDKMLNYLPERFNSSIVKIEGAELFPVYIKDVKGVYLGDNLVAKVEVTSYDDGTLTVKGIRERFQNMFTWKLISKKIPVMFEIIKHHKAEKQLYKIYAIEYSKKYISIKLWQDDYN